MSDKVIVDDLRDEPLDLLLAARYPHPVAGRWRRAGAVVADSLQVLRAIGAGRDPGELGRADGTDPRILLRHKLNDVDFATFPGPSTRTRICRR